MTLGRRIASVLFLAVLAYCGGCAGSSLSTVAGWNLLQREQWRKDEEWAKTTRQQIAELEARRAKAADLPQTDQQQLASEMLTLLQQDRRSALRVAAVRVLGSLTVPDAAIGLRQATQDEDAAVRVAACRAWGGYRNPDSLATLTRILETDEALDVRLAAAEQLGQFNEQPAIQALAAALDDRNPALQYRAVKSLEQVTGRDFGDNIPAWREYLQGQEPQLAQPSPWQRWTSWF